MSRRSRRDQMPDVEPDSSTDDETPLGTPRRHLLDRQRSRSRTPRVTDSASSLPASLRRFTIPRRPRSISRPADPVAEQATPLGLLRRPTRPSRPYCPPLVLFARPPADFRQICLSDVSRLLSHPLLRFCRMLWRPPSPLTEALERCLLWRASLRSSSSLLPRLLLLQ